MALLSSLGMTSTVSQLLKSKKVWMILFVVAVFAIGAYGAWRIESLSADLASSEQQIDQLEVNNGALEDTVTAIDRRLGELKQAQSRIEQTRAELKEQIASVRNRLSDIDFDKRLNENPQQLVKELQGLYNEQLSCLEYASGNKQASCPALTDNP